MKRFVRQVGKWASVALVALLTISGVLFTLPTTVQGAEPQPSTQCSPKLIFCQALTNEKSAPHTISDLKLPSVEKPDWLAAQEQRAQQSQQRSSDGGAGGRVVTYQIQTRGNTQNNLETFAQLVAETYADSRGWSRAGVSFQRVESGGQFTLVLSEASQVPTFSPGCDAIYSCRAGQYVIINEDRWIGATEAWNSQGGSLRDYRHMVINHETGHWLGHGHYNCSGAGQLAPVMQQQSIDLQGCKFNPWPLDFEIEST